jgi:hypothetical protein
MQFGIFGTEHFGPNVTVTGCISEGKDHCGSPEILCRPDHGLLKQGSDGPKPAVRLAAHSAEVAFFRVQLSTGLSQHFAMRVLPEMDVARYMHLLDTVTVLMNRC